MDILHNASVLYMIGFILVLIYFLTGIDDFFSDMITLFKRSHYRKQLLDLHKLDSIPPKLLAVAIAAWHEDNVLGDVIDNIIDSTHYPKSMYHIFLGVYPNDPATVEVARVLAEKYPNVHVVINEKPGPTSKAQNLNHVIRQIRLFEQKHHWRFSSLTIHDSEDVVHPYELKVTNYLLEAHEALQFPVFPLMQMPRLRNFFKTLTTGTYADEFAENHFITMVSRYNSGAFVPSAGTGFALSKKTLELFGEADVLPNDSLTEDYRLSLTLYEKGVRMYYVLERVPRITTTNKLKWDYIATRSMFPDTYRTAVKQKTRWILGITMQSFKFADIFKLQGLRFAGRYSLYKDLKAKVGNLLAFVGYPVLIYYFVSLFVPLIPIYPLYTPSWYLSLIITCMMVERQIFRSIAICKVYGIRSMVFACFLPPLLPLRLIWGNIINLMATLRAYRQSLFGTQTKKAHKGQIARPPGGKKQLAWAKTDHSFLAKSILKRYHRMLGDILLEKGYVSPEQLKSALRSAPAKGQSVGGYLLNQGVITEPQLLAALSNVKHIQYLDVSSLDDYDFTKLASFFDMEQLRELSVVPVLKTNTGFVLAFCDKSPNNAQTILRNACGITVHPVFASQDTIERALAYMRASPASLVTAPSSIAALYEEGIINYEQVIIAYNYKNATHKKEEEILSQMGLLPSSPPLPGFTHAVQAQSGQEPYSAVAK